MNTEEKIEAAGKKKEEGNVLFKAGKYVRASKRYEKVCSSVNILICESFSFCLLIHYITGDCMCRLLSLLSTTLPLVKRRKSRQRH